MEGSGEMRKSESAFLRSLEEALREVTPVNPPKEKEGVSFSERVRQFTCEYGPLIEQVAEFQARAQFDPELQALSAASSEVAAVGPDGKIDPGALGVAERIMQNPRFAALSQSAASYGVRGFGILTANLEAAYQLGIQVGAELVAMRQYTVGDYTVPSEVIGRAWYQVTVGDDKGISGTIMVFPFNLSLWFAPPVDTNHLVSVFITYIPLPGVPYPVGLRLEIFGWLPEKPAPGLDPTDVLDAIHGFRLVVEAGMHKGGGLGILGHQVTTSGGLQTATLSISPNNLQTGQKTTLSGTVYAPHNGGQPNRIFRSSTTMKLDFPAWVFSAMSQPPVVTFTNDGTGQTGSWQATSTAGEGDNSAFEFTWVGKDNTTWTQDMTFSVAACSSGTAPQNGKVACTLDNLDSADSDVERSVSGTQMTLSALVFTALGNYDLKVDPNWNSIENQPPGTTEATGSVNATTANSASNTDNDWYPIVDPTDPTKPLTIDDKNGISWWCGYQYRQTTTDTGDACAQYRAVFWRANTSATERNYYAGLWQNLINDNTAHSTATWSNGASTSGTTLDIFLKPTS
jgi:hypothetical protein